MPVGNSAQSRLEPAERKVLVSVFFEPTEKYGELLTEEQVVLREVLVWVMWVKLPWLFVLRPVCPLKKILALAPSRVFLLISY